MMNNDVIFGIRAVMEAVLAGREIDRLLIKKNLQGELIKSLCDALKDRCIHIQYVPQERLDRITRKNHQGVIAFVSAVTYHRLENVIPSVYEQGRDPFIVLLDGITDVRNFGAIARTCECAGIDAIVIPEKESVSVNADAMKTSAGALNVIPVCKEKSIRQSLRLLRESGVTIYAASEKAAKNYTDVSYNHPVAIVTGAEDTGVSAENLRRCDEIIKIPQFGTIGSLNVSVATSVIIYEGIRQRGIKAHSGSATY
ncbi:MAG: 23S rRNA (guanosine(2251)-2'-O)-methyltransferase RlmB [Tannerella sp.]|jgi:23S rRNA (guanosine2251-2'-O)-methyltransferase|nr:23S rRNA (guanosine(2251)-2'-O)-methyltransferase RlmB [Tannerella sp.]